MKKTISVVLLSLVLAGPVFAGFKSDVVVLNKDAIVKLADDKLIEAYTDVLVEIEAMKTFYATTGFAKEESYDDYRKLLKYRMYLLMEIHSRRLEIPIQLKR